MESEAWINTCVYIFYLCINTFHFSKTHQFLFECLIRFHLHWTLQHKQANKQQCKVIHDVYIQKSWHTVSFPVNLKAAGPG